MSADPHKQAMVLAHAAWTELAAMRFSYEAAAIRGDRAEMDRLRQNGHDLLDGVFDRHGEAAAGARKIIGG